MTPINEKAINFDGMSIPELEALCEAAAERIQFLRNEERNAAFAQIEETAARLGISREELAHRFGARMRPKRARKPATVRYRNPTEPSETWAGRGRKPAWVESHLARGGKLDDLAG
jgi:DNA-binding protein H-NS